MTYKGSDVVIAIARELIQDRTRWTTAPLIGDGDKWLSNPDPVSAMNRMFEMRQAKDQQVDAIRAGVEPMGLLAAEEVAHQANAHIRGKVDELLTLGQPEAAEALQAENFGPDGPNADPSFATAAAQFRDLLKERVKAERPAPPAWLGTAWTAVSVATAFARDDEALADMAAGALDEFLDRIEDAQRTTKARIDWMTLYRYPAAAPGSYDVDALGTGFLSEAREASFVLANAHSAAVRAFARVEIPAMRDATWITERMARMLATRDPKLNADIMGRTPAVAILDRWPTPPTS